MGSATRCLAPFYLQVPDTVFSSGGSFTSRDVRLQDLTLYLVHDPIPRSDSRGRARSFALLRMTSRGRMAMRPYIGMAIGGLIA
jgi:hypothetical protein